MDAGVPLEPLLLMPVIGWAGRGRAVLVIPHLGRLAERDALVPFRVYPSAGICD